MSYSGYLSDFLLSKGTVDYFPVQREFVLESFSALLASLPILPSIERRQGLLQGTQRLYLELSKRSQCLLMTKSYFFKLSQIVQDSQSLQLSSKMPSQCNKYKAMVWYGIMNFAVA